MKYILSFIITISFFSCKNEKELKGQHSRAPKASVSDALIFPEEKHFKSLKQITFGGDNAEAYWSFDDKQIVFQSNNKNGTWTATKCF